MESLTNSLQNLLLCNAAASNTEDLISRLEVLSLSERTPEAVFSALQLSYVTLRTSGNNTLPKAVELIVKASCPTRMDMGHVISQALYNVPLDRDFYYRSPYRSFPLYVILTMKDMERKIPPNSAGSEILKILQRLYQREGNDIENDKNRIFSRA